MKFVTSAALGVAAIAGAAWFLAPSAPAAPPPPPPRARPACTPPPPPPAGAAAAPPQNTDAPAGGAARPAVFAGGCWGGMEGGLGHVRGGGSITNRKRPRLNSSHAR